MEIKVFSMRMLDATYSLRSHYDKTEFIVEINDKRRIERYNCF